MGFRGWFLLVCGLVLLVIGIVPGILAIQQATEISAYHHARACPAGAPTHANCLRTVDGSVVGVTEITGRSSVYELDVRTASTTLHLNFSSDTPMLGYALDGNPAFVTLWRGRPVSVVTDGRSDTTTSVPETALAGDLTGTELLGGMGMAFVALALLSRQTRRFGITYLRTRPVAAAVFSAVVLGSLVVGIGGGVLDGKPSRLGPDLAATGAGLFVVLGLSVWFGVVTKRRTGESAAGFARLPAMAEGTYGQPARVLPTAPASPTVRPAPTRMRPAGWARILGARTAQYVPMLLTVAVLFGVFLTVNDGPPARAFRQAPACVGETNLTTCVGDFTAVINGVRASASGGSEAAIAYVTPDGAINTWASFGGDTATIVRQASADEQAGTPLTIRVWRRTIIGAEFGGRWHWVWNGPPGNTIPTLFLAVSFGLLLLVMRFRIHLREGAKASRKRVLVDDLGQIASAAGSVVLLGYGFWPGAILAVAVLLWLGLSARRSTLHRRVRLAALHSS